MGSKPCSATAWIQPWGSQAGSLGLSFPLRTRASKVPSTAEPAGRPARGAPRCRTAPRVSVHSTGRQGRCQRCLLRHLCNNNKMLLLAPHTWEGRCLMWALMCESNPTPFAAASGAGSSTQEGPTRSRPQLSVLQHLKALPELSGEPSLWNATPLRVAAPSELAAIVPGLPAASHLGQFMGSRTISRVQFPALVPIGPKVLYNLL